MKKTISVVLVVVMLSAVFFVSQNVFGFNQETDIPLTRLGTSDTYYSFDAASKTLTISGEGEMPNFTNVNSGDTAQPWFNWRSDGSIENVVVEEGVTSLGNYAFYYVKATNFTLPSTLTKLGTYSMSGANGINEIVIPSSVTTLGNYAFYYCANLQRVVIPSSVTSIGTSCFENCLVLSSVEFSDMKASVSVNRRAFTACAQLKEIAFPKGARLGNYAFGYQKASAGKTYDDVLMRVYRDSAAYDYAVSNLIDYELISAMELFQGDTVSRTYYADNIGDSMVFTFTPSVTAVYDFYSLGDIDVDCTLEDRGGNVVAIASDNSNMDLNFTMTQSLTAGEEYRFVVTSVQAQGDFSVTLYPHTVLSVIPCFNVGLNAQAGNPAYYDIVSEITGGELVITFDTGYSKEVQFSQNSKISILTVSYSDSQSATPFSCGDNYGTISVGSYSTQLKIVINHSYSRTVVEPTFEEHGYTEYTCISCGDSFRTDRQNRLGVKLTGRVVLMQSPDGDTSGDYPVRCADLKVGDDSVGRTDMNGEFTVYVNSDVQSITVSTPFSFDRTVSISADEYNEDELGNIALVNFDIYKDGYINAKDYAYLKQAYGEYDADQYELFIQLDYNGDGVLDDDDYINIGAYPWGNLTESIYN